MPSFIRDTLREKAPELDQEVNAVEFICVDFETTGMDANFDKILSIGWVTISKLKIDLQSCVQLMVNEGVQVKASTAVINHITPEMLDKGVALDEAMHELFKQSMGKVLVAHGCVIEREFIDQYLNKRFGLTTVPILWLDTLCIEKHLAQLGDSQLELDLRLSSIRRRYGLPEYSAHNALIDALATAELLLAQLKRVYRGRQSGFGRLYQISHR